MIGGGGGGGSGHTTRISKRKKNRLSIHANLLVSWVFFGVLISVFLCAVSRYKGLIINLSALLRVDRTATQNFHIRYNPFLVENLLAVKRP